MKIAILSCNARAYSTRRLRDACLKRGHRVKVLHTLRFSLLVESGRPALFFRNRKIRHSGRSTYSVTPMMSGGEALRVTGVRVIQGRG